MHCNHQPTITYSNNECMNMHNQLSGSSSLTNNKHNSYQSITNNKK